jgi:hypothetical protein
MPAHPRLHHSTGFVLYAMTPLVVIATLMAAACSDATTSGARRPFTVSLTTQAQASGSVASRSRSDLIVAVGSHSLVITKAQLVARRIELAPADAANCATTAESGDDDSSDGCAEVEVGPTLLDLPLDATTHTSISASVPAGSYRGLELRIGAVTSGNRNAVQFIASHPELKNASVRVEGTYDGKSFVFVSGVDTRIETVFTTPITVDASSPNVTVAIDISSWFSDGSGGTLDPGVSSNASRISANIASSFHAFEDDDHDGHDDHHR